MPGRLLLDTNAMIALRQADSALERIIDDADAVWISWITVGELLYGALGSGRRDANLRQLDDMISRRNILLGDVGTARAFAGVKDALRRKGRPIPENDIWIAATAIQHNLVLVTRDAHFDHIDGLTCLSW